MPRQAKPIFNEAIKCPWCEKASKITVRRKVVSKAIPAEYEMEVKVEKQEDLKSYGRKH